MNDYGQCVPQPGEAFRADERLEMMDLMWRYMTALDIGDMAMFRSCFCEEILCDLSDNPVLFTGHAADLGPQTIGLDEFVDICTGKYAHNLELPAGAPQPVRYFVQHGVLNPIITFTGPDTATMLSYNHEHFHLWMTDSGETEHAAGHDIGGFYHNDFRMIGDRWRLSALRLKIRYYDPEHLYRQHMRRARPDGAVRANESIGVPALSRSVGSKSPDQ